MEDKNLRPGVSEIWRLLDQERPLERILTEGRILSSATHDASNDQVHTHWHRKVLRAFDPSTGKVLLSLKGSRNSLGNLDTPDREYSPEELYSQDWTARSSDYEIF